MANIQFQFRRGTSTEWTNANPTLAPGEIGIETNTDLFKIGNGVDTWNTLVYGGLQGATGSQGITGYTGSQGDLGYTGSQGDLGYTGSQGGIGYAGSIGSLGYTGSQGVGYTGSQGTTGYTGSIGGTGYTGSLGYTGSQGVGYTGSQGVTGYTGSIGGTGYTGSKGDAGISAAGRIYYMNSVASDISGYETWTTTPSASPETTMSVTANSSSGWVSIVSFATPPGDPNITAIPVGQIVWHQWQHVSDATGISKFRYRLYKRTDPGGVETQLFEFESDEIDNTVSTEHVYQQFIQTAIPLALTDRIITEVYFSTNSATDVTGYITHDGPTRQSYVITPISQGISGYTGSQGTVGYTGSIGGIGYTGSIGGTGYTGSQGTIGNIGYTGSAGVDGTIGYNGSVGYTGSLGYTGSAGAGYTGSAGDLGYTGSAGADGVIGYNGSTGYTGSQGDIGYTGSEGTGYTGSQGAAGLSGASNVRYVTSTTTITNNDDLIVADGTMTLYLPIGVEGKKVVFKNINNGTVTILANGSQTIDGYANVIMAEINTSFGVSFANTSWLIF